MDNEKPWGKEAVKEAIMKATAELIAERGVSGVSLRDIAQKANVNHGLITRHFGTKEALVTAVGLDLVETMFEETLTRGESLGDAMLRGFDHYSFQLRVITRILLDDPKLHTAAGAKPLLDKLLDWIKAEQAQGKIAPGADPVILVMMLASLVLGNELFGPHFRTLLGLSDDEYRDMRPRIFRAFFAELGPVGSAAEPAAENACPEAPKTKQAPPAPPGGKRGRGP